MGKRRRGVTSEWIRVLQQSRRARALRIDLPIPMIVRQSGTGGDRQTTTIGNHSEGENLHIAQSEAASFESDERGTQNEDYEPDLAHVDMHDGTFEDPDVTESEERETTQRNIASRKQVCNDALEQNAFLSAQENEVNSERCSPESSAGTPDSSDDSSPLTSRDIEEDTADISVLEDRRKKWENKYLLSAIVAVIGSVRLTVRQYEYVRMLLRDVSPGNCDVWPPYYKIRRYFNTLLHSSMAKSSIVPLQTKNSTRPNPHHGPMHTDQPPNDSVAISSTNPVRIFYPSGWAKLDVSTSPFFARDCTQSLEAASVVQDRSLTTDAGRHLFVECGGTNVECKPGSIITVSAQSDGPACQTPFQIIQGESEYSFKATVAAIWTVGGLSAPTPSWTNSKNYNQLTAREHDIMAGLSVADSRSAHSDTNSLTILPGDLCTLLRAERECQSSEFVPVIVHRFWRYESGMPSALVLWLNNPPFFDRDSSRDEAEVDLHVSESHAVSRLSLIRHAGRLPSEQNTSRSCRGTLADGTSYVVYRMLLYCDDFQRSSYTGSNGSSGGCYFMPLAIPPEERRQTSAVRLVSLTPPGVSTNEVLSHIIPDIVKTTIEGVDGHTVDGERVKIFIDVIGFIGDYPASSAVIDVLGHVARAPCTLCTFRRPHPADVNGSRYGYTTKVHANNPTFLRNAERHDSLHRSKISDKDANRLGISATDKSNRKPLLLLHKAISRKMNEGSQVPLTSRGAPVVPAKFDPYRCNVIAPDHLLTGLSKDILNVVFLSLPTKKMRLETDICICAALRENGLLQQKEVYNWRTNSIHSFTLSELFCVLLVAVPTLKIMTAQLPENNDVHEPVRLMNQLHQIVRLTYWWPQRNLDGVTAEQFYRSDKKSYFSELKRLSKEYVQRVDAFCMRSQKGKEHLDKPNLHRILELYEHSLPAFGHAREFMELIFESVHQPLKRSIANSNNHEDHIFAMEQCVGNDWQGRLASLSREIMHDDTNLQLQAKRGLRRLMLGMEVDKIDATQYQEFISETDNILSDLFTPAVEKYFSGNNLIGNFARKKRPTWRPNGQINVNILSRICATPLGEMKAIITTALQWINTLYPPSIHEDVTPSNSVRIFKACKRVNVSESDRQIGGVNGFDKIFLNCVVQVQIPQAKKRDKVIRYEACHEATPAFFIFISALHRKGDLIWALCLRCSVNGDWLQAHTDFSNESFQILCLTDEVRRVAVYHVCQDARSASVCKIDTNHRTVVHRTSPLEGARLYFQRRVSGYPPRVA